MSSTETQNPWKCISSEDYEKHMSNEPGIKSLALKKTFEKQYNDYVPKKMVCLGVSTGNGLGYVKSMITQSIYGIDINADFLETCKTRYAGKINNLILKNLDLNREYFDEDKVDLVIANLILEYLELERFMEQIFLVDNGNTVISIVFQSKIKTAAIAAIEAEGVALAEKSGHVVSFRDLNEKMEHYKYAMIKNAKLKLPDGGELVRVDYRSNRSPDR